MGKKRNPNLKWYHSPQELDEYLYQFVFYSIANLTSLYNIFKYQTQYIGLRIWPKYIEIE